MAMDEGFSRIQYESVSIDKKLNCLNLYLTYYNTITISAISILSSTDDVEILCLHVIKST
jgi:hypothetical protein